MQGQDDKFTANVEAAIYEDQDGDGMVYVMQPNGNIKLARIEDAKKASREDGR